MTTSSKLILRALAFALAACLPASAPAAIGLDPEAFTSLGTLSWSSGDYTIDTDALTIVDDTAPGTPLFTGVVDDQEGSADSFGGVPGPLGIPEIAVFTFDAVTIDGTANVSIVGTRALAILSQGDMTLDRTLSVDGAYATVGAGTVPGAGGPGGFAGGAPGLDGLGPGGGLALDNNTSFSGYECAAGGSFGGQGGYQLCDVIPPSAGGAPYGNLRQRLQGGSGGGGTTTVIPEAAGGGGGGALELGASGTLTLGASGMVRASGGLGTEAATAVVAEGGPGSGGGVRLIASVLVLNGTVEARGTAHPGPSLSNESGGGRVLRLGDASLGSYVLGSGPAVAPLVAGVDVSPGVKPLGPEATYGWITAVPVSAIVPPGGSFELGSVEILQTPTTAQPGVEILASDLIVNGQLTIPAGGITYGDRIDLVSTSTATVTGTDALALGDGGQLGGSGTVQVDVAAQSGARIVAVGDDLSFTGSLTNQAGASTTCVSSTLTVPGDGVANDDGIVNQGTLNLVDCTVNGDVRSPAGSTINVAGTVVFNGLVSGAGTFSGTTNTVVFNGGYSPGD
jgi:hypothetical protein